MQRRPESDDGSLGRLQDALIMMVDDESITMDVVQTFLEDAGYRRFVVTDQSTQAMSLLVRERPDVVLLDLMMPEVSGFDILKAMRKDETLRYIPVIVLTSSIDAETKLQALELGATDFLAKPVDPSELALRVRNTLAAKAYQDQLAYYDALTGLPNRRMFIERADVALRQARRENFSVAALHVGLDRFKQINDSLGLRVGDALLREIARRLDDTVRESDEVGHATPQAPGVSRLGGDEFCILLPGIQQAENASAVARRLLSSMTEPFLVSGHEVFVTPSIGIAVFPNDGRETETIMRHAASATEFAKKQGRNTFRFYSKRINARSVEQLNLETQLRKAMDHEQFELYYQPKVDTASGALVGVEALIRWIHPGMGIVPPDAFIPLAEETGIILAMGEWAMGEACRQSARWKEQGIGEINVAINVSANQFRQTDLARRVADAAELSNVAPRCLTVELTESILIENARRNIDTLHQMKELGVHLSVDDFGTGFSSLSYLKRFPVDEVKVDRSFVKDLTSDRDDAAIVTAIIAMAHSLGLEVVAEGVETDAHLAFLQDKGCDRWQGFLMSKPLPAHSVTRLLRRAGRRCAGAVAAAGR